MKNVIYFLSTLILFQSCYAYKSFDIKDYETVKPKKVKIELLDSRKLKGKIIEINTDKILLENYKEVIEVPLSEVKEIQKRKFSYLKALGIILSVALITSIILLISNFDINFKGSNKKWHWNWI